MTGNIVARRYAKALFALGRKMDAAGGKKGDSEVVVYGKELDDLSRILASTPDLLKFFRNPIFSVEEKKSMLDFVSQNAKLSLSPMVGNFLKVLADKNRLAFLPQIVEYYSSLLDLEQGVQRGEMTTAMALSAKRQEEIKAKLEAQTGRKLVLGFAVNPEILGGLVLKIGDKVLDASLRAQLQIVKEKIKRGE